MESKINIKTRIGLPNHFKLIGSLLIIFVILTLVFFKLLDVGLTAANKELLQNLTKRIVILGLLFISLARDKFEDEMIISLKLRSMAWAFIWAALYVIVYPITDLLFRDPISNLPSEQLVSSMLLVYLITYNYQKFTR